MKFKIEIHSTGYENTSITVDRKSRGHVTKTDILQAKAEWCKLNDVDMDSEFDLPFVRITKAIQE